MLDSALGTRPVRHGGNLEITVSTFQAVGLWRWVAALLVAGAIVVWFLPKTETPVLAGGADLNYTLKDTSGKAVHLADYRGKPILMTFWATWCGPCRTEIPIFNDLAAQFRDEQLTVLGISVDDSAEEIREFMASTPMNYTVLLGKGQDKLQETYDAAMFVPITWLIRADGSVFLKHQGPATREWFENQVKSLVATAPPGRP